MPDNRLHADGARVLADLHALRSIGAYKTGVHKPTFSEPHMRSLEWLAQRLAEAGLTAAIDGIGNVFGTATKSGPKLLAGSHLESQNFAGWLDGPLGVVYALEAARIINPDPTANGAVEVAVWCDEEGHFGSFLGSRSYVGAVTDDDIDAARDRSSGRTMRDALRESVLPTGRAKQLNAGGISDISRRISSKAKCSKAATSRLASSPRSSASGNTASPLAASKITPVPPGWTFARTPVWRSPGFALILTIASPGTADHARYGPPGGSAAEHGRGGRRARSLQRRGGASSHRRPRHDGCHIPADNRSCERRLCRRQVRPHAQRRRS